MQYFVTGTDTGVGKTLACAWLCTKLGAAYWKPVQCGVDAESGLTDREEVARLSGQSTFAEQFYFKAPRSPHHAATLENRTITLTEFRRPHAPALIIEGAGGVFVPLNDRELMIDLIAAFALPAIVVARGGLGTINHSLLTMYALRRREIQIAGVILTGDLLPENATAIRSFGGVEIIGHIPWLNEVTRAKLSALPSPDLILAAAKQATP